MPNYRRLPARILWGATYQNALDLGYPLDGAIAGSTPREGSEWAQGNSGAEDAWITAHDQWLQGDVRWIPRDDTIIPEGRRHSGWNGTTGWRAFLEWARAKNVVRFYPDARNLVTLPRMSADGSGDGIADGWSKFLNPTATADFSIDAAQSAQKIVLTSSTPGAGYQRGEVNQRVYGLIAGVTLTFSVELMTASMAGDGHVDVGAQFFDGSDVLIRQDFTNNAPALAFERRARTVVVPALTAYAVISARMGSTNGGGTGTAWFRNYMVEQAPSASATFIDNPSLNCYVAEPMSDDPEAEQDFSRKLKLRLRTTNGAPFDGY